MTYRTEFPDFDPTTLPDIPEGWEDVSHRNDACPCFETPSGLFVYVDYLDVAEREMGGTVPRFSIVELDVFSKDIDSWDEVKEIVLHWGVYSATPV